MKKLFCFFTIFLGACIANTRTAYATITEQELRNCTSIIIYLFDKYCKTDGYRTSSNVGAAPSYGEYNLSNGKINIGCYKYKRNKHKQTLKTKLHEKCNFATEDIEITEPERPSSHVGPDVPQTITLYSPTPITISGTVKLRDSYLNESTDSATPCPNCKILIESTQEEIGTTDNTGKFSDIHIQNKNKSLEFKYNEDYETYTTYPEHIKSPIYLTLLTISGYIKTQKGAGNGISDATITNLRTNKSTNTSNDSGSFSSLPARPTDQIEISATGYKTKTVNASVFDLGADTDVIIMEPNDASNIQSTDQPLTTENTNNFPISGTVQDDQNKPISDATVTIKDTSCSAKTGTDGKWKIDSCDGKPTLAQSDKLSITHNDYTGTEILLSELPAIILSKTAAASANIQSTDQQQTTSENKSETSSKPTNESDTNSDKKNNQESDKETAAPKLSREDSQKKIDELQKNADAMKEKEQSTANKLLGGAAIGATGIGAMQAASAYSEQQADEEAEQAMKAYLATFHCNYGGGINVPGGEKDVQLPGGNELIDLYAEYVNLANNLKVRKAALDMRPGIESESILDSATSGLYDDVAIGKTSGAFTSLARALQDPDGEDAKAWAAQKDDSAQKMKTGLTMAGIGAIGGAVGNLLINKDAPKENSKEINAKYEKLKKKLEADIAAIPPQTAQCPSGTSGSKHPDCTCNDTSKIFNPDTNACDSCSGVKIAQNGECVCPSDKPLWDNANNQCIARPTSCTPQCTPTEGDHLIVKQDCSCACSDGYDYQDGKCTCTGDNKTEENDKCITTETKTEIITEVIQTFTNTSTSTTVDNAVLPAGSLFKIGSADLLEQAKNALNTFVTGLKDGGFSECELTITGYTNPVGGDATNKTLSTNRANSVKTYITGLNSTAIKTVNAEGKGEDNCTCGTRKAISNQIDYNNREYSACKGKTDNHTLNGNARFAPCRRVEISASCKKITTTSASSTSTITN